jgi:AcrR family transcriptional regulator
MEQERVRQIIDAAQKRFGIYGYEKTTMSEIASDLDMCKGSLYYYFPDKEHLYIAVVKKEHDFFIEKITQKIDLLTDASQMVYEYMNIRVSYFTTLLNLSRLRHETLHDLHSIMHQAWKVFRDQEEEILIRILKIGIEKGEFECRNIDEHVELFLDVIRGLTITSIKRHVCQFIEKVNTHSKILKSK